MPEKFLLFENFSIKWNEILEELAQSAGVRGRQPPEADEVAQDRKYIPIRKSNKNWTSVNKI